MRFLARLEVRTDETARHSVSCIVMQRTENVPDAFSRFTLGKHPFLRFLRQKASESVSAVRTITALC